MSFNIDTAVLSKHNNITVTEKLTQQNFSRNHFPKEETF